ncbi:MAG: hypothetical protein WAU24_05855 [Chitinophagaceae bacterium]
MPFLETLYGSQFEEIKNMGKDGAKGRLNGNLFLSVMIMMLMVILFLAGDLFSNNFGNAMSGFYARNFDWVSGKTLGKLIAIPLLAITYFIVSKTVGNEVRFNRYSENYMQYPEDVREQSNKKLLVPFFVLLSCIIVLAFLI